MTAIYAERKQALLDAIEELHHQLEELDAPDMVPPGDSVPMQPLVRDEHGVVRFRENKLVCWLLEHGPHDMNALALLPDIPREDHAQFAQLIGYSVFRYAELPYAIDVDAADAAYRRLVETEST